MIQGQFPLWLLTFLLGLFLSAIVFCTTTNDCPPKYHPVSICGDEKGTDIVQNMQDIHSFSGGTKHKVQLRLMGMSLVLQVFGHKPKYWTNTKCDLVVALHDKSGGHQSLQASSSVDHECLHKIWCQSNQQVLRYFR